MGLLELFVEKARVKCCEVTGLDPLNCEIGNIRQTLLLFSVHKVMILFGMNIKDGSLMFTL
jgi:hypothetical protein